jgi:hypothetical protein
MSILARGIKLANPVPVQRPHDTDARVHQEVAAFRGADQAGHRGLPFLEILLSLRLGSTSGGEQ